ncbi:ribosomal protein S15 [Histoplasma capsulatum H143]|uniref:Ribosomal protein S15 n=1 Tax=Ajellomyces capsulatus (strain H143) TaxID=544712 RepID=C6HB62_AJECH|nr:ribosomal protein S15 [Histoplasma capsulatum H143]
MPPQLLSKPYFRVLNAPSLGPSLASSGRSQFSSNSRTKTRKGQNPYAIAQARQRKAANLSRQAVLKKERASSAYGEPVLGNPTPFIESLMSKRSGDSATLTSTSASPQETPQYPARPARAGPDTGSSEVQAAILTTKIQVLAQQIAKYGHKDKHNKRNLRVLVHRRQRLLNYLRRKERGGPRWQNLMSNLGLTDSSWKGEIIYSYAWDDVEDSTRHFFNGRTTQITKGSTRNPKECTRAV